MGARREVVTLIAELAPMRLNLHSWQELAAEIAELAAIRQLNVNWAELAAVQWRSSMFSLGKVGTLRMFSEVNDIARCGASSCGTLAGSGWRRVLAGLRRSKRVGGDRPFMSSRTGHGVLAGYKGLGVLGSNWWNRRGEYD
jgi:hypothetical protein